jgi:hypothetical protein
MSDLSITIEMANNDDNHLDVPRDSFTNSLSGIQILTYILKSISDGKNENQIVERFDGNAKLVRICVDALIHIRLITKNYFDELILTDDGKEYLEKFDLDRLT